jgi:phage portal protein BeeE
MRLFGLNISRAPRQKESPTWSAVLSPYSGMSAVYTPADYEKLAKAGYQTCAPVYAVVSLITRSARQIPWVAMRRMKGGDMEELESHPALDLLVTPNEYQSGPEFIEAIMGYKLLAGNSYVHKVHGLFRRNDNSRSSQSSYD